MNKPIEFEDMGGSMAPICPGCGGSNLHHIAVDSYKPESERLPAVHVHHTIPYLGDSVSLDPEAPLPPGVKLDENVKGNPSADRHGLVLTFYCETCDVTPVMAIAQHKGNTLFCWV